MLMLTMNLKKMMLLVKNSLEAIFMKSIRTQLITYAGLVICFAFVVCLAVLCLTSCSPNALQKDALLRQRVEKYHSALSWNSAKESSTFTKDPLLRIEILRNVEKDLSNVKITEYAATSVQIDENDKDTATVTARMKYLRAPQNIIKTKDTTEKWQFSDKTWFLIETDAFE